MEGLSVAASIIQVIDVSSCVISSSIEIHKSQDGQVVERRELEETTLSMARDVRRLRRRLDNESGSRSLTALEREQEDIGRRCQSIANELLETLQGLRYEGPRSPWKSFRQALASAWNDEKIQGLEHRLDRYRQQMTTNVLSSLWFQSEKMSLQLDQALSQHRSSSPTPIPDEEKFLGINFLEQISAESRERWSSDFVEAILARSWQSQPMRRPYNPDSPSNQEGETSFEDLFLQRLKFKDMMDRQLRIPKAHTETFKWIFCDTEDNSSTLKPEVSFRSFLQNNRDRLYWVTGKPGSGKSTLMKYIYQNPDTMEHLRVWHEKHKLVTASFYFWNSGSNIQMSVTGLLQTLLYECLKQLPSAIPIVFPERWELFKLFGKHSPWRLEELQDAFRSLIVDKHLDAKFFIFVDGLDECNGNLDSLITFTLGLCESSSRVKMCVASRPWAQFEDSFKRHPHLLLQDLTKGDIARYIASNLSSNEGFHELEEREPEYAKKLRDEIATKAQGVFLWVNLVVKSLLDGFTDGDGLRRLQQRLNELPPDLEDLFRKILTGLEPAKKDHASQLFQLVRASHDSPTLLTMAFADLDDADYVLSARIEPWTELKKDAYGKNMRRKLSSQCRGLLEATPNTQVLEEGNNEIGGAARFSKFHMKKRQTNGLCGYKVQYLHRTVKDFVETPEVWDWLLSFNTSPFNAQLPLARAFLLHLKVKHPESLSEIGFWEDVLWCVNYAKEAELAGQGVQVELLDELDRTATSLTNSPGPDSITFTQRYGFTNEKRRHWTSTHFITTPGTSFLYLMTMCGMRGYLEEKLKGEEGPLVHKKKTKMSLLVAATSDFRLLLDWGNGPAILHTDADLSLIQFLLDNGANPVHELDGRSALSSPRCQGYELLEKFAKSEPPRRRRRDSYGDMTTEIGDPGFLKLDNGKRRGHGNGNRAKHRRTKSGTRSTRKSSGSSKGNSSLRTSRSRRSILAETVKCVVM
ncbi:hypothetical protein NW762_006270 [Fusarium torreyae]|uniref:NACHT domain-containing protein n=1 Tax=Fusarium torreyae TaxID=1237075 RepID=A0A9W8VFE9_9HYPO|nr:hypothetical protein NW762_006270 [Fusarium torreyae]